MILQDIFDSYNFKVEQLVPLYQKLNKEIRYPDGMITFLGIIYWGKDANLEAIEAAIPKMISAGATRFKDLYEAIRTPAHARKFSAQTGVPKDLLRILKHDLELWLPASVSLNEISFFQANSTLMESFSTTGIINQLSLITAGQTLALRKKLANETGNPASVIDEAVKVCDFYRTGKNLDHIRSRLYYDMGLDTWQIWATQTAESVIETFTNYIEANKLEGERLVPWPKEVRNGIEWAKWHLEVYEVEW